MELRVIHDKLEVREFLDNHDRNNYMFHCADIEEGFFEYAQFYGLYKEEKLLSIAVVTIQYGMAVLLGSSYNGYDENQDILLRYLKEYLPNKLYCHLNKNSYKIINSNPLENNMFYNMKLNKKLLCKLKSDNEVVALSIEDEEALNKFYEKSHEDALLDENFLAQNLYYGIWKENRIIAAAGIFSNSQQYGVIQIGNVATDPDYRNKGIAKKVISTLILNINNNKREVVLNVKQDNMYALKLYKNLGFEIIGEFEEVVF